MTAKQLEEFKNRIYEPYSEAWSIMKYMRDYEPKDDAFWKSYMSKCEEFLKNHPNEYGSSIYRVLLDAGSEVKRIGKL